MKTSVDTTSFRSIKQHGNRIRNGTVTILYRSLNNDRKPSHRFSPVLSKRQGTAVKRNRIKRIIREYMRTSRDRFPSGDYIIYINGNCSEIKDNQILNDIENTRKRIIERCQNENST